MNITWADVDERVLTALALYQRIYHQGEIKYLDLIIRLLIMRVYVFVALEKLIRASRILEKLG